MSKCILTFVMSICFFLFNFLDAGEDDTIDLSILNDTDSTILIVFTRSFGACSRAKLLEAGEAIDFGRVYEASVQSYSTLWGYIAPAECIIYSSREMRASGQATVAVRIKGITGRTLFCPFGQWDYDIMPGKKSADLIVFDSKVIATGTVLDVFPTAKRKIMYTPRYILGLPQYACFEDALEASMLLIGKWRTQLAYNNLPHVQKFTSNVIQIIDESRKAFQHGQADVPLHIPVEMRSQFPGSVPTDEDVSIAWS